MKIKIIENFLNEEDLDEISKIDLNPVSSTDVKVYHNSITRDKIIKNECMNENLLIRLNKTYHDKAIEILRELNPKKEKLYDFSEFHIIETGSNYKFPIHDDTPDKLLSGVIYIKPQENAGTIFYDNKKGDGKKEVKWEINKSVFFSRNERETWHSYKGNEKTNRIVLVYNLMTKQIKKVYEIEQKNYLLGNIRYRLNPYLFKYFGFTI